jgi:signal transduction histidine kinase
VSTVAAAVALCGWLGALGALLVALGARRALARRMELVARACHELRGPLTAARLGLELGTRVGSLTPERLRALDLELGAATLALDDLAAVRRDSWAVVRRDSCGPSISDSVDIEGLLVESAEAWRAAALRGGAELRCTWIGGPAFVRADRLRLAQAIGNLIANAIEHGGGVVELRGRADAAGVRIELTDGGPGLPAPVAELTRRARDGRAERGRGLAIASEIAISHGGRLAAAPSERGARLVLELGAEPPHRDDGGTLPAPVRPRWRRG